MSLRTGLKEESRNFQEETISEARYVSVLVKLLDQIQNVMQDSVIKYN